MEECILDYMALYIECQFNQNSLLQSTYLAFAIYMNLLIKDLHVH